jgi:protein ImuB
MSLALTNWPIDRLRRRGALPAKRPFALATTLANRRLVTAVEDAAAAAGVAPGMALADAQALLPSLALAEADFAADAAALARLARWCGRYSPWTAPNAPDGVWLDVTGCAHLQGGEAALAAEAVMRLAQQGIAARVAIADSAGAAWALARYGDAPIALLPFGVLQEKLAPLPVAALRLAPEVTEGLVRLGLRRIGDLTAMPRPSLVMRFGHSLADRLDQALGRLPEPLSPVAPPPLRWARRRFAEPIATLEILRGATSGLLTTLCRLLEAEGQGARRLELTLYRVDGTSALVEIGTAQANRSPRHLLRLLEEHFDTLDLGLGIEDMVLAAAVAEPLPVAQLAIDGGAPAQEDLAALIDRLDNHLGKGAVRRPDLRQSHWPERAVRFVAPNGTPANNAMTEQPRPVRLLAPPEPIEAVAPVPDDPPVLFRWRRVAHRVRLADGPERIAGEWWRGNAELRDYYRVEDQDGRRFWLYRAGLYHPQTPARWFLHGVFA